MKNQILGTAEYFVLVVTGALAITLLAVLLSQDGDLHCEEDEVAVHGGLEDWYDPGLPLECVNLEEFPGIRTWDEGFDAGFGYGLEDDVANRVYDFAYDNGYGDALSDAANGEIGGPLCDNPGPTSTPTPTPAPELPSPPPEPATAPVDAGADKEGLVTLVNAAFPDDPRMGGRVVWNESLKFDDGEWQGYVYGNVWSGTGDCGLMQINWRWHEAKFAAHGWDEADCFNPAKNLVIAQEIYYSGAGCDAWTTC